MTLPEERARRRTLPSIRARRLIVYVVWDRRGDVEDYVAHALEGLREHARAHPGGRERGADGRGSGDARASGR